MGASKHSIGTHARESGVARLFASPASVLVILPLLVVSVGIVVLLLGRKATRESTEAMARHQLVAQAKAVQHDVSFALGQANPVLSGLKILAEPALATPDAVARMRDVVVGRPGVANASIVFPIGVMWGTFVDPTTGELMVHETRVAESMRTTYRPDGTTTEEPSTYDPRSAPPYELAVTSKQRSWLPPRTFSSSHKTGLTVSEPIYEADGSLGAVLMVDFDVSELSKFIRRPPLEGARTVMFVADGTILAYPAVAIPKIATEERRLLRYTDFDDPALTALIEAVKSSSRAEQRFLRLETPDGDYIASVAVVGGKREGEVAAIDWYLATLVPEHTLFGATRKLGRVTIIASAAALAIALGVALMFAWNLVRMRRAVGVARAAAKSAEQRAKELGSYRLVAKLGAGGMGEVWRAEHQLLARQAAIKLVRREALIDPEQAEHVHERFRREAQTLASLRSRHTIELYDYGVTDDGSFFFVMELLDGLDLSQLVRVHGPQPAARVISILAQACQSLAEAHDAGLLHRDIKPANLFLCRAADEVDIVKLLDFGIVHNIAEPIEAPRPSAPRKGGDSGSVSKPTTGSSGERLTTEGAVVGTPGYIPPEQLVGAPLDARGDLYALGCVAWWLLVGEDVYRTATEDEAIRAHISEPIPTLKDKLRGWCPRELEDLIVACLAKQPRDRPENARVLADALFAIVIPAEHAWTRSKARAWWSTLEPIPTSEPEAATMAGDLVVSKFGAATAAGVAPAGSGGAPGATRVGSGGVGHGPPTMVGSGGAAHGPPTMVGGSPAPDGKPRAAHPRAPSVGHAEAKTVTNRKSGPIS